jgi:hypothetical protein
MPILPDLPPAQPTIPAAAALAVAAALLALAALAGLAAPASDRGDHTGRADHADHNGADQADPLDSLAAPVASQTWDLAFWSTHQTARTPLWHAALAYCLDKREAAFPACTDVRLATWWRPAGSAGNGESAGRPAGSPEPRP